MLRMQDSACRQSKHENPLVRHLSYKHLFTAGRLCVRVLHIMRRQLKRSDEMIVWRSAVKSTVGNRTVRQERPESRTPAPPVCVRYEKGLPFHRLDVSRLYRETTPRDSLTRAATRTYCRKLPIFRYSVRISLSGVTTEYCSMASREGDNPVSPSDTFLVLTANAQSTAAARQGHAAAEPIYCEAERISNFQGEPCLTAWSRGRRPRNALCFLSPALRPMSPPHHTQARTPCSRHMGVNFSRGCPTSHLDLRRPGIGKHCREEHGDAYQQVAIPQKSELLRSEDE